MKTKTIKQTVAFNVSPQEVYDALMDSKKHSTFTGAKAVISKNVGGKYYAYDGYHGGVNLELKPGEKIVQSWHAQNWEKGHFAKATFRFSKIKGGTRLVFTHSGVPESDHQAIIKGWKEYYWNPMKEYFGKKK
ncbi:MAG: SRPBCC domain-containing protein [Bacteroidetes bacterium]|nr:SRPBCC domain-containing protein [Bacteroidota bacterium]